MTKVETSQTLTFHLEKVDQWSKAFIMEVNIYVFYGVGYLFIDNWLDC